MEGPSFFCAYLGFSAISKPPTSMGVLQNPVRDMYYKYRKSPTSARTAAVRLTQRGVLLHMYGEGGVVKSEIFFDFGAVVFVETARFSPVRTSSERKPKALFLPIEQDGRNGVGALASSDKHAFLVEKSVQFLVTAANHPPLVVCVVRRPQGVKALDCHVMSLESVEDALHIASIISSASQSPVSPTGSQASGSGGAANRLNANFDKGRGPSGDVIRTEYGEYSVYRGPQQGPGPAGYEGVRGPDQHRLSGPPGGRNGYLGGGGQGGIVLTQDNFMTDSVTDPHYPHQYPHGQQPGGYMGGGGGMHAPGAGPPVSSAGYQNRPPDVIMHAGRPMSGEVNRGDEAFSYTPVHDRSFNSSAAGGMSDVMRRDEGRGGGGSDSRLSGNRMSGDYPQGVGGPGRVGYLPPGARPMFPPVQNQRPPLAEPSTRPVRYGAPASPPPTSPRTQLARDAPSRNEPSGEIFSASNLESRNLEDDEEEVESHVIGGRPVAKVPPHFKAGIKVLPSDFRAVKLKHNNSSAEDKRSQAGDDKSGYDNNKAVMERYREMQEAERNVSRANGGSSYPDVAASAQPNVRGGFNYSQELRDDHNRDFRSRWEDSYESPRQGNGVLPSGGYGGNAPQNNRYSSHGDYNYHQNHNQQAAHPVTGKSQSAYALGAGDRADNASGDPGRFKDLEIANMFANVRLDGAGGSHLGNNNINNNNKSHLNYGGGKPDYFPPSSTQNDFEYGLGYLP